MKKKTAIEENSLNLIKSSQKTNVHTTRHLTVGSWTLSPLNGKQGKIPAHVTLIQYSAGSASQRNKAHEGNQRYTDQKHIKLSLFAHDLIMLEGSQRDLQTVTPETNK